MSTKTISNIELSKFKWPKNMPSFKPKVRKRYSHNVIVISNSNPNIGYVHNFTSERSAREHIKSLGKCTNDIEVGYEKSEIVPEDDGYKVSV